MAPLQHGTCFRSFILWSIPKVCLEPTTPTSLQEPPLELAILSGEEERKGGGVGDESLVVHSRLLGCANLSHRICPLLGPGVNDIRKLHHRAKQVTGPGPGQKSQHHRTARRPKSAEQPTTGSQNVADPHPILSHLVLFTFCLFPLIWLHHIF